jgi:hypothetical protein
MRRSCSARGQFLLMPDLNLHDEGDARVSCIAPNPFPWAAFEVQVRKPRLDMPAYREAFVSAQELADMYAYLLSIKPAPTAKEIPLLNF